MSFVAITPDLVRMACATLLTVANLNGPASIESGMGRFEVDGQEAATSRRWGKTTLIPGLYGRKFAEYAAPKTSPVMDVGSAWLGVNTIPALKNGARVIANDLDVVTLAGLWNLTPPALRPRLELLLAEYPQVPIPDRALGAILFASVLHFADGQQVMAMLRKAWDLLRPGGRVFVEVQTPFMGIMQKHLPDYRRRRQAGDPWPGLLRDAGRLVPEREGMQLLNLMDRETLMRALTDAGFEIIEARYFARREYPDYLLPPMMHSNPARQIWADQGTDDIPLESVGAVAVKPWGSTL